MIPITTQGSEVLSEQPLLGVIVVGQITEKFYKRKRQKLNLWDQGTVSSKESSSLARTDMVEEAVYLAITEMSDGKCAEEKWIWSHMWGVEG